MHPLRWLLDRAATGRFPAVDGEVDVHPADEPGRLAIVEFTGHAVVLVDDATEPTTEIEQRLRALGADGYGGASHPEIKRMLAGPTGTIGTHDAVLVAFGTRRDTASPALVQRHDLDDEARVRRARHHRRDVRVFGDEVGFVTLGHGLVGRLEMSVELLDGATHGSGSGRRLISAGLELVPAGDAVWAQVAPGNAASLRAFLACGFRPVGAETLIDTRP